MTEEEQEELADKFYAASEWFASQGELAGWLWTQDRAPEANKICVAVLDASLLWGPVMGHELLQVYFTNQYIKEKSLGWKRETVSTPYG